MEFSFNVHSFSYSWYIEESKRIVADERFAGISLYENSSLPELADDHSWHGKTGADDSLKYIRQFSRTIRV